MSVTPDYPQNYGEPGLCAPREDHPFHGRTRAVNADASWGAQTRSLDRALNYNGFRQVGHVLRL